MKNRRYNKFKVSPKDQRTWNGRTFASKAEMEYAQVIQTKYAGQQIAAIVFQPPIRLGPIDYVPDFAIQEVVNGPWKWIDVKGMETPEFKIKKKLWAEYGPGELIIVKKSGKNFKVVETVVSRKNNNAA